MQQGCDNYAYLLITGCIEWPVHVISLETTVPHILCCCIRKDTTHQTFCNASYRFAGYSFACT